MQSTLPIGVFDSGIGGLTILKALQRQLPHEKFIYVADMGRLPYGDKTPAQILEYVQEILSWMAHQGVKMVVMACNTSSALALAEVKNEFSFPIVGIIDPTAKAIALHRKHVGIIATTATTQSAAYQKAFQLYNPDIKISSLACPEFVPLIEANRLNEASTYIIVHQYIQQLMNQKIDTLVYGCTHYPYLSSIIQQILPPDIQIIDPADYITNTVLDLLSTHQLIREQTPAISLSTQFYTSGHVDRFNIFGEQWLGQPVAASLIDFRLNHRQIKHG